MTPSKTDDRDPSLPRLVVFSDDWGRHPSSCQHLISQLVPRYRVDWVHTIGTRRPKLDLGDLKRGAEKAREWLKRSKSSGEGHKSSTPRIPHNLRIHSPVHWPGFQTGVERKLNWMLLWRSLKELFLDENDRPEAIITTASIPVDLARSTRKDHNWFYYCVDDLAEWPGLDGDTLRDMEIELLEHVRGIVCVSEHLQERLAALGRKDTTLITHGIDPAHWNVSPGPRKRSEGELPTALYWGHADQRLHVGICLALAERTRLVMVGPRTDVGPRMENHPRIEWRGKVPYADLPQVAEEADVLVMPYADLPVTRAMQPLKLKEYLATGRPAVATPLPANQAWSEALDLTSSPEEFVRIVLQRAEERLPAEQAAARLDLAAEAWSHKARDFEEAFSSSREKPLPELGSIVGAQRS
ncbi:MAG: glycosyltransferase [Planctomycetota bacterium]